LRPAAGRTVVRPPRRGIYAQVLARLNESAVAIWLYDRGRFDAFQTRVHGPAANGWDVLTWNAGEWSVQ
jgi:hypothetical protein